jgi:uncharacterized delta-60 repeat protein
MNRSMKMLVRTLIAATLVASSATPAWAQAGTLDATFSGDGWVATDFTREVDFAYDVAISETDGTIVAAGQAGGAGGRFALVRYTATGALDPTFGGDGRVVTNFTSGIHGLDRAFGVALQADGKIVAAGAAAGAGGRVALARYNANGSLDTTFSGDGKVMTNFSPGDDFAWTVAIQPSDQKIVVAGGAGGPSERFLVARYNPSGALDTTFSADGRVLTDFTRRYDYVDAIVIQEDGKIVVVGAADYFGASRYALARYDPNGALDATFSVDGKNTTTFPGTRYSAAFGVAIQADGKIVVGGQAGLPGRMAVVRYGPSGVLDPTFSGDGRVTTEFTNGDDYADEVMVQADGKIVAVGSTNFFGRDSSFALARFHTGGALDTTFSADGKVTTNLTRKVDWATGAVLQPVDGNIVVVGRSGGRFAAARYLAA